MLVRESPFIFEDAVPKEKFFDRKQELNFFVNNVRVKRKMLLCIVAPLKYGKSSLMQRYHEILLGFPDIISIYINLKKVKDPIRYIITVLTSHGFNLDREYREGLKRGDLRPLFDRLNELLTATGKWLFLLLDEFHLLPELVRREGFYRGFSDELVFGFFRGLAEGARISYVVCGSVIEPLMRALDIWGGRFQVLYLGPFDEKDAVDMIKSLFREGGMIISDEHAKIIAEAAGYHPFYIQYMGHQIYVQGEINRETIRNAKKELYNFLLPIFEEYFEKIGKLEDDPIRILRKIINREVLDMKEIVTAAKLRRMGIIKPANGDYLFVDPLFERYVKSILAGYKPIDIVVVGHWAERIVGNYLLSKGYIPYYSHDSRGVFDIYVRIRNNDIGIQVKYSSSGEIYLSEEDAERIVLAAKEMGWIPILAIVSKQIRFFPKIKPGKYTTMNGYTDIRRVIESLGHRRT